jgi:hypothetical protein
MDQATPANQWERDASDFPSIEIINAVSLMICTYRTHADRAIDDN